MFLVAAMLWGFAFVAQKASDTLTPFVIGATRNIIATVFLLLVIPTLDRLTKNGRQFFKKFDFSKSELLGGVICGAVLTAASAFQQLGMNVGTDAGKSGFITALYVLFVPIIALALRKKSSLSVWLSVIIAVVGFYFLCIEEDFTIALSDAYVLICAVIFALHIIVIDRFSPGCDGVRMSAVQFFSAFIFNLVLALVFDGPDAFLGVGDSILPLLYLGICSSGVAYTLQIVGQRNANPAVASVILSLESAFAVLGGAIFLGEKMSPREYIGCAIVFAAVILSQIDFSALKAAKSAGYDNKNLHNYDHIEKEEEI